MIFQSQETLEIMAFWIFHVDNSQQGLGVVSGRLDEFNPSIEVDGFQIDFTPSEKEYHQDIFDMFGIKAKTGIIVRECKECKKLCKLDRETFVNYRDYVYARKEMSKISGALFGCRFFFSECSHPITPDMNFPEDFQFMDMNK